MIEDKLLKALFEARKLLQEEGEMPQNMFHPDYGWIIVDGKPTENAEKYYKDYVKNKNIASLRYKTAETNNVFWDSSKKGTYKKGMK